MVGIKKRNRILSGVLATAVMLTMLPASVFAAQIQFIHSDLCEYEPYIPCSHIHDDLCGTEEQCTHVHDAECGYYEGNDCTCAQKVPVYAQYIDDVDQELWEGGQYVSSDFQPIFINSEAVEIKAEYYPAQITVGDETYLFYGFNTIPAELSGEMFVNSFTIPAVPADIESEEYSEWRANWSDGIYPVYLKHTHAPLNEGEWESNDTMHWQLCECEEKFNDAVHDYEDDTDTSCNICTYERCIHELEVLFDDLKHWNACKKCDFTQPKYDHIDIVEDKLCDTCGYDISKWKYFTFGNSANDFFAVGEKRDYALNDYEDDYIEYFTRMYKGVYIDWYEAMHMFLGYQDRNWGGSCYGFGVVEVLSNLGLLNISKFDTEVASVPQAPAPSKTNDKDIRSLLNYYWLTQFMPDCRGVEYYTDEPEGRAGILEFAEYIAGGEEQNKALFCYIFEEYGYTYGHAIVVDGGVKNEDGSYILNGRDNRFHGWKWKETDEDVTVQVKIAADGTAKIYTPGGNIYCNEGEGEIYEFTENILLIEYTKAETDAVEIFDMIEPEDLDTVRISYEPFAPVVFVLLPSNAQATETMKISNGEYELSVNDIADGEAKNNSAVADTHMIVGGTASIAEGALSKLNSPAGMVVELTEATDNYVIKEPEGTVSLTTNGRVFSLTTSDADNAEFNTTDGSLAIDNNNGEFAATVTNENGTIAKVTGNANGDINIIPNENGVGVEGPAGEYKVEYTKEDGSVTQDTIIIKNQSTGGGGGGTARYTVKFETNGGSTISNKTVTRNSTLDEPTPPTKSGYTFEGWYTDRELTAAYDFEKKVTKAFTLYAKWKPNMVAPDIPSEWINPFTDVDEENWFYNDVKFAAENELMQGTTETAFEPNTDITRAMMVTVLWRMENEPVVNYLMTFEDVEAQSYYAEAVRWAASEKIIDGYSQTEFAPNDNITREQIAAIMHRYAQYKGYDVSVGENTNILSYDDFADISEYAIAPMQYATGAGLLNGKTEGTLNPKDFATRAEIAAILHRFIEANK